MACEEQRIGVANGRPIPIRPSSPFPIVSRKKKPFASKHGSGVRRSRTTYNLVPCRREHRKKQMQMPMNLCLYRRKQRQKRRPVDDENRNRRRDCTPNEPTETPATSPTDIHGEDSILLPSIDISRPAELYHLTILSHNVRGMKESRDIDGTRANSKLEYIALYMEDMNIDVYVLQETWLDRERGNERATTQSSRHSEGLVKGRLVHRRSRCRDKISHGMLNNGSSSLKRRT